MVEVDEMINKAKLAGVSIQKEPAKNDWGGY